jgi:O-antigen/teichoic acid export membrane protein
VENGGSPGKAPGTRDEAGAAAGDPRPETQAQRDDRNMAELIQELRVVSLGVQVLFGFLLSLPFTVRFERLDPFQRDLYLASLVLSAVATTLLLGPVAYHRLVFRRGMKEELVRFASVMASLGLAAVGGAVLVAVLLVTDYVAGPLPAALITALVACLLGAVWYAMPVIRRHGGP